MMDDKKFDQWANAYEDDVFHSDKENTYPFAGYRKVLGYIYDMVMQKRSADVLELGFGTGVLTNKLYEGGCTIYGQDFSQRMIDLAQEKMPEAHLYQGDFTLGLANELMGRQYDSIIATYSLHHLSDTQKVRFFRDLLGLLAPNGCIYVGDVAFRTREELEACRRRMAEKWDEDEIYFVFEELNEAFPQLEFEPVTYCSGVLYLKREG